MDKKIILIGLLLALLVLDGCVQSQPFVGATGGNDTAFSVAPPTHSSGGELFAVSCKIKGDCK